MAPVFEYELVVPATVIDTNDHVNNVAYVQWMQDVAIAHSDSVSGTQATQAVGATWVARSHKIEYLRPSFLGDRLCILTWISDLRKARSKRKYRFLRAEDGLVLATGETDWVFVDMVTGRPRSVPESVSICYELLLEVDEQRILQ
ncbi:MAG TPA: thioesterase family protein [Leptolyngbyaceae cyanobacterium]